MTSVASLELFRLLVASALGATGLGTVILLALLVRDWRRGELW